MIHLTLTGNGSSAARTLCWAPYDETASYWHWRYCTAEQLAQADVCQACKDVVNEQD
jgi:hypothetical protein